MHRADHRSESRLRQFACNRKIILTEKKKTQNEENESELNGKNFQR